MPVCAKKELRFAEVLATLKSENITCFISHAWDKDDVFIDRINYHLRSAHIITYYDRQDVLPGVDIVDFMTKLAIVDFVIAIFTPTFKKKVESVKYYSGIKREWGFIYHNLVGTPKFIPLVLGDVIESVPSVVNYISYIEINQNNYYEQIFNILTILLPAQKKQIGILKNKWIKGED